ncbi:hypothetical protein HYY69_02745 [Candidatus Woesearchaeota archaeon]|nr:hypothetical protein [Candidatus Woesearchaeota archaeon]
MGQIPAQNIALVSSDLNGTLVHQHTMSDMIRLYVGEAQFQAADLVFKRQTSGTATMEEAFSNAGPLTKRLTLRQAIEYTQMHMKYVDGFSEFVDALSAAAIPFVVNSTGYSVTIYAIRESIGATRIHGFIGNYLKFGLEGDPQATLREDELEQCVRKYFAERNTGTVSSQTDILYDSSYDSIQATGVIELGITDETAKARLIIEYARKHFPEILPAQIAHIGDTMGDSGGILQIAQIGGKGIAFNYNNALENFLEEKVRENPNLREHIHYVDPKGLASDLRNVLSFLLS